MSLVHLEFLWVKSADNLHCVEAATQNAEFTLYVRTCLLAFLADNISTWVKKSPSIKPWEF